MVVVILDLEPANPFPLIVVFALGSALAAGFLGGYAAAEGMIPIFGIQKRPVAFAAGGGVAVLVIAFLLGAWFFTLEQPRPGATASVRDQVLDLRNKVNETQSRFEQRLVFPVYQRKVYYEAADHGYALRRFDNGELDIGTRVTKNLFAGKAFYMAAAVALEMSVETQDKAKEYARLAVEHEEAAQQDLATVRENTDEEFYRELDAWARNDRALDFSLLMEAESLAVLIQLTDDEESAAYVPRLLATWDEIDPQYRSDFNPREGSRLRIALTGAGRKL